MRSNLTTEDTTVPDSLPLAHQAVTRLREQCARHGIDLPDLTVNLTAAAAGVHAVHLGDAPAEVVLLLADRLAQAPTA